MRAELATRNVAGIFSGDCPHCNEPILSDSFCGERFSCAHCSGDIEIQNYGDSFLFTQAKVKLLPSPPRAPRMIDPDTYCDY
jgi:hypothetical protein